MVAIDEKSHISIHPKILMLKDRNDNNSALDSSEKIIDLIESALSYNNEDVKTRLQLLIPEYSPQ